MTRLLLNFELTTKRWSLVLSYLIIFLVFTSWIFTFHRNSTNEFHHNHHVIIGPGDLLVKEHTVFSLYQMLGEFRLNKFHFCVHIAEENCFLRCCIYFNGPFNLILIIFSFKRGPLLNIRVSLEMLRERPDTTPIQFRIGPLTFEGIRSLDGDAHLPANSSFTAQWLIRPVHSSRLMNIARYQVHFLTD